MEELLYQKEIVSRILKNLILPSDIYGCSLVCKLFLECSVPLQNIESKKIIIIGDTGVGKTSYMMKFKKPFEPKYTAVDLTQCHFEFERGIINYSFWDTAHQEKFGGLRDAIFANADAAIIMYDITSRVSFRNIMNWVRDFKRICEDKPFIIVGNKLDIPDRTVRFKNISPKLLSTCDGRYQEISVKAEYNIMGPLETLAQIFSGNSNTKLIQPEFNGTQELCFTPNFISRHKRNIKLLLKIKVDLEKDEDEDI